MSVAFCPHCGCDIRPDQPVLLNDFSMFGEGYPLCYRGRPIKLTPGQLRLVWALMKAYPHTVRDDALLNRIGSDGESNVVDVMISKIRARLRVYDIPNHIETMQSRGYRWSLEEVPFKARHREENAKGGTLGAPPSLPAK